MENISGSTGIFVKHRLRAAAQSGVDYLDKGPLTYRVFCALKFVISNVDARYAR